VVRGKSPVSPGYSPHQRNRGDRVPESKCLAIGITRRPGLDRPGRGGSPPPDHGGVKQRKAIRSEENANWLIKIPCPSKYHVFFRLPLWSIRSGRGDCDECPPESRREVRAGGLFHHLAEAPTGINPRAMRNSNRRHPVPPERGEERKEYLRQGVDLPGGSG
jgi:hypothetical protein